MCHIVLGFDSNYAMPSGVAMYSVCKNTNRKIHFHIIEESVGNNIKQQFKDMVESFGNDITFYQISDEKFKGLPENAHISKSTYNRFLIPELLSEDINKCLYIDGDLLAVRGLEDLLSIDLDENIAVAAAIDARCSSVIEHNAIDLPLTKPYYNAGVMLYNLNYWRKHHVAEQCLNYIERTHCPWMDQDAINAILFDNIYMLDTKYNLQINFILTDESKWAVEKKYFCEINAAIKAPVIIHYSQSGKPWHKGYKKADEWLAYKRMTPWKDVPLSYQKGWLHWIISNYVIGIGSFILRKISK